ncbi:5-oxoprolinase subunit PxpB [Alkalimonas amylolytica]|uniref:Sensor histidine kinase inhibitor, KipI family n=1 Tax=Alkalimonas amylolytica TaxID=152573 RepID=A0A1H4BJX4_ALKAM|nr:5-oxoprolinase subunit PxpB [Alkalimonas amylolytica]SEA48112.1 sensor histidine kinase inhibitor, KipI family [Alkalimonas amylolytica]
MLDYRIQIAGENSLILYPPQQMSAEVNQWVLSACQQLEQALADVLLDVTPSYASILVSYNPLQTDHFMVKARIRHALAEQSGESQQTGKLVELPVYYSEESGPDLARLAQLHQLSIEQVIELHQAPLYRVYAIGFAPGFAYMGEVDERLATPRLDSPRAKVPKGAVAIADRQTAVYPAESPGGWNLLGLCPLQFFDPSKTPSMPVAVGDQVRFTAINKAEFLRLGGVL